MLIVVNSSVKLCFTSLVSSIFFEPDAASPVAFICSYSLERLTDSVGSEKIMNILNPIISRHRFALLPHSVSGFRTYIRADVFTVSD